jgi:hypothetical protein
VPGAYGPCVTDEGQSETVVQVNCATIGAVSALPWIWKVIIQPTGAPFGYVMLAKMGADTQENVTGWPAGTTALSLGVSRSIVARPVPGNTKTQATASSESAASDLRVVAARVCRWSSLSFIDTLLGVLRS